MQTFRVSMLVLRNKSMRRMVLTGLLCLVLLLSLFFVLDRSVCNCTQTCRLQQQQQQKALLHQCNSEVYRAPKEVAHKDYYLGLLAERDQEHRSQTEALKHQITDLKRELMRQADLLQQRPESRQVRKAVEIAQSQPRPDLQPAPGPGHAHQKPNQPGGLDSKEKAILSYIRHQIHAANEHKTVKDEYEVTPYNSFTAKLVYHIESGLGHKPAEKPKADKKSDLVEAVYAALDVLNTQSSKVHVATSKFGVEHFVEGVYRTDQTVGTVYDFVFQSHQGGDYQRVELLRPFAPLQRLRLTTAAIGRQVINMIVPLKGRVDTFRSFLDRFVEVCIQGDRYVHLTVVYFGVEGLGTVRALLDTAAQKYDYRHYQLVTLDGEFSRGRGLAEGVAAWTGGDTIQFFCDVDIFFTQDFFDRCRLHSEHGKKVYYPMVFSLYNPAIVYKDKGSLPPESEQFQIHQDHGFWRDFGFGMTCQYKSDFLQIRGFDLNIKGWGGEDVHLYRKYLRSELMVFRAPDRGLIHTYHPKHCAVSLAPDQYKMCIGSKALNEASHSQLGMLAFKDEIDRHVLSQAKGKRIPWIAEEKNNG